METGPIPLSNRRHKFVCTSIILFGLISLFSINKASGSSWQDRMLISLNSVRTEKSLPPLKMCRPLVEAAQKFAQTMANQNFYSHTGRDGSTPGSRIQKAGYNWMKAQGGASVAENIAAGQKSVSEVIKAWSESKPHYKNMTSDEFTHVGFGMATNPKSKYKKYWVQNFGSGATC